MSSGVSRQQWREFHYGKPSAGTTKVWCLKSGDHTFIRGAYALCNWRKKQIIKNGELPAADLKTLRIVPYEH